MHAINPRLIVTSTVLCVLLLLLAYIFRFITRRKTILNGHAHLFSTIKSILQPPNASIKQLLEERARANQRLVRALNLSNTFVSCEEKVHKDFVARAHCLLGAAQRKGWLHFQSVVRDAVDWQLKSTPTSANINCSAEYPFHIVVQNITLYVVLVGLLDVENDPSLISYEHMSLVANNITTLWALSKKDAPIPPTLLHQLNDRLRILVTDKDAFPFPLDFVIPAWETMWRVVATTVAYSHKSTTIRNAFDAFDAYPNDDTFKRDPEEVGVSIKNVVTEAMRLNPPSKRIGRSKQQKWCPSFLDKWVPRATVKADVEALLMSADVWGLDVREFVPSRYSPERILPEQKEGVSLVFGQGPLRCIAALWAPMAAAVVAGTVLKEYTVVSGTDIGGREGWKGWALRKPATSS